VDLQKEQALIKITEAQGSRINKFAISSVEAPAWQGVEAQEYPVYFKLPQRSRAGCIDA